MLNILGYQSGGVRADAHGVENTHPGPSGQRAQQKRFRAAAGTSPAPATPARCVVRSCRQPGSAAAKENQLQ
jgi:hypothetical protein